MPERATPARAAGFASALGRYQRQLRLLSLTSALLAGAAAGALSSIALVGGGVDRFRNIVVSVGVAAGIAAMLGWFSWTRWPLARVAHVVDRAGALDNLVVTAEEILAGRARAIRPVLEETVFRQAEERLHAYPPERVAPLGRSTALSAGALIAFAALLATLPGATPRSEQAQAAVERTSPLAPGDLRVVITPPAYIRRSPVAAVNPDTITAIEGSRVRLEMSAAAGQPFVLEPTGDRVPFASANGAFVLDLPVTESRPLLVRQSEDHAGDRLVSLTVQVDARPIVNIRTPAKDLMFGDATGAVPVEIEARDDVALDALALRFTKVSGSGEGFIFKEGTVPIEVARTAAGEWRARGTIALGSLGLEEGDTVVYQATARDQKPGADPSVSESYLIEIGKAAGVASTGFALPDDRERQGLSQQMVIVKTERLEAQRAALDAEAFAEQAKLLGIEQRMVRAEFVFMTGGEVEDEVEEAASAHELSEGRLENRGQAELLTAVREMSRAEARLNSADTRGALVFERAALRALQRAFDRRRYLLRTTPERARIDLERRLHGDLANARSSTVDRQEKPDDPVVSRARVTMMALAGRDLTGPVDAMLAAQLIAVEPASEPLRTAALSLSAAQTADARATATLAAGKALQAVIRARLGSASQEHITADPLRGRFADELARTPR